MAVSIGEIGCYV